MLWVERPSDTDPMPVPCATIRAPSRSTAWTSVSLGVATCVAGSQLDYDALFADADAALLAAKAR